MALHRFMAVIVLTVLVMSAWATFDAALHVNFETLAHCLADANSNDIWEELHSQLAGGTSAPVTGERMAAAAYSLTGALRAGRRLCPSLLSAANVGLELQAATARCVAHLGVERARQHFSPFDPLYQCLASAQRSTLMALAQTHEDELAQAANAAAATQEAGY